MEDREKGSRNSMHFCWPLIPGRFSGPGRRCAAEGLCRFRPRRDEGDPYTSARFMNFVMNVLNADTLADGYRPMGNVLQTANWGST